MYIICTYILYILFQYLILFSCFSGLKPNLAKSEIVGIGVLKGVQVAVCGMHCIGLNNDTLKNIRYPFLLQWKLNEEKKIWDCERFWTSIENMENEKPYIRRENKYF